MSAIKAAVVGATGYSGIELLRLLNQHPNIEVTACYSKRFNGQSIDKQYDHFIGQEAIVLEEFIPSQVPDEIEVLFLAVPHAQSHTYMDQIRDDLMVIDLSADFRLNEAKTFEQVYQSPHQSASLLSSVPYGLPECHRDAIKAATKVANPGCYATSIILGAYPLAQAGHLSSPFVVNAQSGISGAGRSEKTFSLFCERHDRVTAYQMGQHRHQAEIDQELGGHCLLVPHVVPMSRGILAQIPVPLTQTLSMAVLVELYHSQYDQEPFVHVKENWKTPSTSAVTGSNMCMVGINQVSDGMALISVAIDNLLKGAAGQAVQNMNLMMGWDETLGLPTQGRYL